MLRAHSRMSGSTFFVAFQFWNSITIFSQLRDWTSNSTLTDIRLSGNQSLRRLKWTCSVHWHLVKAVQQHRCQTTASSWLEASATSATSKTAWCSTYETITSVEMLIYRLRSSHSQCPLLRTSRLRNAWPLTGKPTKFLSTRTTSGALASTLDQRWINTEQVTEACLLISPHKNTLPVKATHSLDYNT